MTEYPGVIRTSLDYIRESITQMGSLMLILGLVCSPMLVPFLGTGRRVGTFALFGFLGLIAYLGQVGVNGNLSSVEENTDTKLVGFIVTILLIVYYNCLVFISVLLATTTAFAGFEHYGIAVALLYPFYDIEMAEMAAPLSIGGAFVFSISVIARFLQKLEELLNIRYLAEDIDSLSHLKDSRSVIRDFALLKFNRYKHQRRHTS